MKRKGISLITILSLLMTLNMNVLANSNISKDGESSQAIVTYKQASSFIIALPAQFDLNANVTQKISVSGVGNNYSSINLLPSEKLEIRMSAANLSGGKMYMQDRSVAKRKAYTKVTRGTTNLDNNCQVALFSVNSDGVVVNTIGEITLSGVYGVDGTALKTAGDYFSNIVFTANIL